MSSNKNHRVLERQSLMALLLIIVTCALLFPIIGIAEDDGAILPLPSPPIPDGGEQTNPDTTYIVPDGEDLTGYLE